MSIFTSEEIDKIDSDWFSPAPPVPEHYLPHEINLAETSLEASRALDPAALCPYDLTVALAAKGFVIVSGPSGTGKTRGGLQLAQAVSPLGGNPHPDASFVQVAVGADWTDGRHLLGFKNPFGKERRKPDGSMTNETYEITDALRLLLAAAHPDRANLPHFLILDEMNLSHVERYFSAFLSLMESSRSLAADRRFPLLPAPAVALIAEVLADAEAGSVVADAAARLQALGRGLPFPDNLFILGTVNVDETTYMFSPKVLDRAHVLELGSVQPKAFINGKNALISDCGADAALEILRNAIEARGKASPSDPPPHSVFLDRLTRPSVAADPQKVFDAVVRLLDGTYTLLEPVGFGFGYRVVNEVFDYLLTWFAAEDVVHGGTHDDWRVALDRAFLQKVLPKIHGNRRQLGDSLTALAAFLEGKDGTSGAGYQLGDGEAVSIAPDAVLTLERPNPMEFSRDKLKRMNRRLLSVGYATFVE